MLYCPNAKNTPNKNVKLFKLSIEFGEGKNGIKCERKANGQRQAKERKAGKGKKYQERLCGIVVPWSSIYQYLAWFLVLACTICLVSPSMNATKTDLTY